MAAQTNPKAKTMPRIRYVHRKRISGRFSGSGDETAAEKVEGPPGLVGMLRQEMAGRYPADLERQWQTPRAVVMRDARPWLAVMIRDKNQTITKSLSFLCAPDPVDPRGPKGK
jgi:hypothetical protein